MRRVCPVCGAEGTVQVRGNSARIGHYRGYRGKTRIIEWHRIQPQMMHLLVNNDSLVNNSLNMVNNMVNKKPILARSSFLEPRAGFGPATPALPRRSPTGLGYRGTRFLSEENVR